MMSRLEPKNPAELPDLAEAFEPIRHRMGFIPNSQLVMAHRPKILKAFLALASAVYDPDAQTSLQLRNMVAHVASRAAGCRYCMAHTANNAGRSGVESGKIASIWEFDTSDKFSAAEKAALHFALAAASIPNTVEENHFSELKKYFDDGEIVELMAVVSFFGFLNRWNDSMGTALEDDPLQFAREVLSQTGWSPGKHLP